MAQAKAQEAKRQRLSSKNSRAAALRQNGKPIAGLFADGEMVGGLFGENYPGGSGLMSGAVFGKIAGASAARHAKKNRG